MKSPRSPIDYRKIDELTWIGKTDQYLFDAYFNSENEWRSPVDEHGRCVKCLQSATYDVCDTCGHTLERQNLVLTVKTILQSCDKVKIDKLKKEFLIRSLNESRSNLLSETEISVLLKNH